MAYNVRGRARRADRMGGMVGHAELAAPFYSFYAPLSDIFGVHSTNVNCSENYSATTNFPTDEPIFST